MYDVRRYHHEIDASRDCTSAGVTIAADLTRRC